MIVALLGFPGSGRRTLAAALALRLPETVILDPSNVLALLKSGTSESVSLARAAVESGRLIPDEVFGKLLAELVPPGRSLALLLGVPRNLAQFESLVFAAKQPIHVIHLRASAELIDQRRRALRQAPIEEAHPGALSRLHAAAEPVLTRAASAVCLLSLDATATPSELAASAERCLLSWSEAR